MMKKIKAHINAPAKDRPAIRAAVEAFAAALSPLPQAAKGWSVNITLSDNPTLQRLNKTYRGKDKPTNVLSFPTDPADPTLALQHRHPLGDIIFAHEVLQLEAETAQTPYTHHLQHLTIHGLLHLLGYDHERGEAEAALMESAEIFILKNLDIPNPYAAMM